MPPEELVRRMVHYAGTVQGVGFRYTTARLAAGYDVRGFVKNLADGRVLLVVEGAQTEVERLLGAVRSRMADYIRVEESALEPPTGEFTGFEIRR